jgi:hypothetical protein
MYGIYILSISLLVYPLSLHFIFFQVLNFPESFNCSYSTMWKFSGLVVAAAAHPSIRQMHKLESSEAFTGSYVTHYGKTNETVFAGIRSNMTAQMTWAVNGSAVPKFVISLSRNNPRFATFVNNVGSVGVSFNNTCRMQAIHGYQCNNSVPCGQCGRPDIEGAVGMSHMAIWNHMVGD